MLTASDAADRLGARSSRRCTRSCRWPRTCGCSRGSRSSPTRKPRCGEMLAQTGLEDRADDEVARLSGGNQPARQHRDRAAVPSRRCCCSTSRRRRSTRASASGCGSSSAGWRARGTAVVFSTHNVAEAERYAHRCWCWSTASCCSAGTPAELEPDGRRRPARLRGGVRRLPARARPLSASPVRWLFVKDLQILRRSPLLVGLLIVYPVVIALMIGFALSSPPGKPKVAFFSEVAARQGQDPDSAPSRSTSRTTRASCSSRSRRSRSTRARRRSPRCRRPGAGGADHPRRHRRVRSRAWSRPASAARPSS